MMTLVRADEELIRAPEVCKLAGISYRKLDYWVRAGIVVPVVEASGQGSQRLFTVDQAEQLRMVAALRDAGVSLERIREAGPRACLVELLEDLQDLAEDVL